MPTRLVVIFVCAIILGGFTAPPSHAAVTVEIGDNRAHALKFVQERFGLSESAALSVLQRHEQLHGDRIIDALDLPSGAVMDFVRVDGEVSDPSAMVTYEGSGVLLEARHDLFFPHVSQMIDGLPADEREHVMKNIRAAIERGWFVQTIDQQQRDAMMRNNRRPGEELITPQQVRRVRLLVVLNNFPRWDDRAPTPSSYDQGGDREHPVSQTHNWYTPGGVLSTSNYQPGGLTNWSHTGTSPTGGTNSAVSNHPRIEYRENGQVGTAVHLKERWFNLLFDNNNPLSVSRYYFANSHGNLSIEGNRSDIVGPLESRHQLDRVSHIPNIGGIGYDYAIQPGTPVIRRIPEPPPAQLPYGVPNLRGLSSDSSRNIIGTLGYSGSVNIFSLERQTGGTGAWAALAINARRLDQYDNRRMIFETAAFNANDNLRAVVGGVARSIPVNQGFNLNASQGVGATLLSESDVLGGAMGNRLLSMCYYTHDHLARPGQMGSRPYQLRHLRSNHSTSIIDDICGTVEVSADRFPRPAPYDHDITDHSRANMGFFEHPDSTGNHNYQQWLSHLNQVLNDYGIDRSSYDAQISLYPSDNAAGIDQGGTSGPWSGAHVFIPNSAVVLPSDAGLYLTAHELGHRLMGWPDLYDLDFYLNAMGVQPPRFVSNMMGPYSIMADGFRVCAFLKTLQPPGGGTPWVTPIAVTSDIMRAEIPEIEGTLRSPIVYKMPGRPHYIADNVDPDLWDEFYLIENRNRTGENYFGDQSYRGLYIYKVDMRFDQRDEWSPMVIIEQADGLFELQQNPRYNWGDMSGDPFPGSTNNRNFTQLTTPNSWSHGWVSGIGPNQVAPAAQEPDPPPGGVLQPGSSTDSFTRVANISDPGAVMRADLHVVPREVVVTSEPIPGMPAEVEQGTEDFPVMHLKLDNDRGDRNPNNLSRDHVQISSIRIDENGSSQDDSDIIRVSLWDDTDGNQEFSAGDTRIATAFFQNQTARFTNLIYPVPLGEVRHLFVTYDISPMANSADGVTVGAGVESFDYIVPEIPGAVQRRVRDDSADRLGAHRFPLQSNLVKIIERPDTLLVEPISRSPVIPPAPEAPGGASLQAIEPGQTNVPILSLNCSVDQGSVTITRLRVDQTGTINGPAHITAARLYLDQNANGVIDPGDQLLGETRFSQVGGVQRAVFDIAANAVQVNEATPRSLLLTASLSEDTPVLDPPNTLTLIYTLEDSSYITLQHPDDRVSDENFPMSSEEVSTPLPDEPPAPPTNLQASKLADGSIMLNWNLSADDPAVGGEADVVRYHIYRSQDAAALADAEPMSYHTTVGAGVSEFNDLTAPLGVPFYYMIRAFDQAGQEGPNSNIDGPVTATDEAPPTFSGFDPAQGATAVSRDSSIAFVMEDTGSGVDRDTLVFEVDGVDVADAPQTTISGTPRRYTVEYTPEEPFEFLQQVEVRLQVADIAGNVAPGPDQFLTYSFTVEPTPTLRIAGLITGTEVAGVEVRAGSQTATSDADGVYEITGLAAGTYNVTPRKRGLSFQPEHQTVTVPPDAFAINFVAGPGFDISGEVVTTAGAPLGGVTITDGQRSVRTEADGSFLFRDVPAGDYILRARLEGWGFSPATIAVRVGPEDGDSVDNNFTASADTFGVSGTIRTQAGARLAGIEVQALHGGTVIQTVTSGANGAYAITDLTPDFYTIRPVSDQYAFEPTQRELELGTDMANVDFTAAGLYAVNLPAGVIFVALPIDPLDPDPVAAFGEGVQIARWDPAAAAYVTAPSDRAMMRLAPGRGFWTRTEVARQINVPGERFPNTEDLTLILQSRWNMVGNPYDRDLPWERVRVQAGSPASPYGFIYDRQANTYRLVSTVAGLGARTTVPRQHGFWMRSVSAANVTIQAPGTAPASAEIAEQAARKPASDAWVLPIVARAGNLIDASSLAGVLPQAAQDPAAYRMDNPPAVGDYVDLYFLGDNGRRLAVDVRASAGPQSWQFEVVTSVAGAQVQLELPDLSEVPADRVVYLIDEDADRRIYARTTPSYSYSSGEGGARRFRLEVVERTEAGLTISAAGAQAGAAGATVTYTLSTDASVGIEVLNMAGRTIAVLAADQATPAGLATSTWNGRSTAGTLVPSGRYLVRISARADDGQQTQALVPLQLER